MTRPSASRPGSPSSIECWEVVSFPLRSSSSEVSRGRQVDAPPRRARRDRAQRSARSAGHRRGIRRAGLPSRARLGGAESVEILAETELDVVCATLEEARPDVCVIDSVQTLHASALGSAPGSVGQVREAAGRLLRVAKEACVATILVGHVTKDGAVAGPRVLEHLVDCVLQFEGDRYREHRVLQATKNRFGSTNELGVFEMTAGGLVGVPDPSELFGSTHPGEIGAAVSCALEGTRPILLDSGARHADRPRHAETRRNGVDPRRLAMIVAVLGRCAGVALAELGRVRQRRRRGQDRGAGGGPGRSPGHRFGSARYSRARRCRGVRGGRPHGPPAPGGSRRTASRRVREDAYCDRSRARRDRDSWRSPRGWCRDASRAISAGRGPRRPRSGRVDVLASGGLRTAVAVPLRPCEKPAMMCRDAGRGDTAGTFT